MTLISDLVIERKSDMETIRNYLESMFSQLPNTPEVLKAKYELGQMMEDKYSELIADGKSENEVIGTIIAEFGNLDELAESLGIGKFVHPQNISPNAKTLSYNDAAAYLKANARHAYCIALGVLLCIIAPISPIISDCTHFGGLSEDFSDAVSMTFFFVIIAIAVGLFVCSGINMSKWKYLKSEPYCIDFATASKLQEQKESYRSTHALLITVGIMLCILSVVPSIILGSLPHSTDLTDDLSGAAVLLFVAVGVFMIVFSSSKKGGFDTLLNLNNAGTVGGNFVPSQKEKTVYNNPAVAAIMSVYWPTTTCLYLCWSFLTFDWHISWIIWPVAAIIESLVKNILGKK